MIFHYILLVSTAIFVALITGLMWGFETSVNPGLKSVSDLQYLRSMQEMNKAILNPIFLTIFVGSTLLLIISTILFFENTVVFSLLLIASIFYIVGQFLVTITQNVPLNERLESIDLNKTDINLEKLRSEYALPWNRWHTIRTLASILSLIFILSSLVLI